MKKLIVILILVAALGFSTQAQAAWHDWFNWSKIKSVFVKEKIETPTPTSLESQNKIESQSNIDQLTPTEISVTPENLKANSNEIESLKAEVATLKTNLDNLYKAHNELVVAYNKLSKSNDALSQSLLQNGAIDSNKLTDILSEMDRKIAALENKVYSIQSGTQTNTTLLNKITSLDNKLESVCSWIFGGLTIGCPAVRMGSQNIEDRIKRLEGGY